MMAAAFSVAATPLAGKAGVRCRARRAPCAVRAAAATSEMVPDMDKRVRAPKAPAWAGAVAEAYGWPALWGLKYRRGPAACVGFV